MLTVPAVLSIEHAAPLTSGTNASSVSYLVTFSEPVANVNSSDFALTNTGSVSASLPVSVSGGGAEYTVSVEGIQGSGQLRLDVVDDDSIENTLGDPLGGLGAGNGNFQGQSYTIDQVAPHVQAINGTTPANLSTGATSVVYTVTFSETVAGVDPADFTLQLTGTVTATGVTAVDGAGAVYNVTVSGISGSGTLRLKLSDNGTIQDASGNRLFTPNGPPTFGSALSLPVGLVPIHVTTADLNADGQSDLVVTNFLDNNVGVLLGNGSGTFQNQVTYSTGLNPNETAIADVSGDGNLDLVVANLGDDTVSVLLGNGNGTFLSQTTFPTGADPQSVAVADVNNDGRGDIVIANLSGNTVGVLLGNGDGTFQAQVTFPTGLKPQSITVADVNGDLLFDLIVANFGNNNVGVLLGNGDGTFQPQTTFPTGLKPQSIAVTDVNGDTLPDVVVVNSGDNEAGVLLGNGNGTFQNQITYAVGTNPQSIAVGDVNGDGKRDLVVANFGNNNVGVLLGNGGGTFQNQVLFSTGASPQSVALADANGDHKLDLFTANFLGGNASVLLGNSVGDFAGQIYTIETATQLDFIAVPGNTLAGTVLAGPGGVKVAIKDQFGNVVVDDSSTVTLTLVGGTFVGGGSVAMAPAVGGIATFASLVIDIPGTYALSASAVALAGDTTPDFTVVGAIVGRKLFYKGSPRYNVTNPMFPGFSDDNAIASDKVALLPGTGAATFVNVSSYTRGINGVMVDLYAVGEITADDFIFRVGNNNSPSSWVTAPAPTMVTVRAGAGVSGSDRVTLKWADGAIKKSWLEVIVLANADTGLPAPDTFYFGNALGDSGMADTVNLATVDITDELGARNNPQVLGNNIPISNIYDYNRDGIVDITDQLVARNNFTNAMTVTRFLNLGLPPQIDLNGIALGTGFASTWSNAGEVVITGTAATLVDGDGSNITSMTASIVGVHAGDMLAANTSGTPVTASYNAGSGVLTLGSSASPAQYQQVLRTIKYDNTSGGPGVGTVFVEFVAGDGQGVSVPAVATVTINAVPPVIDLDGPGGGVDFTTVWSNQGGTTIADFDATVDDDSGSLVGLTATLGLLHAGDVLTANTFGTSISASYDAGAGVLELSNSDSAANYQAVLRSIKYDNTLGGPGVGTKQVFLVADDGSLTSATAMATIDITSPFIDLNGVAPGTSGTVIWTNSGGVTIVDPIAALVIDSGNLTLLTVTIPFAQVGDSLSATTLGTPVSASFNAAGQVLTLSGSATADQYQQVLRTVKYNNSSGGPLAPSFVVNFLAFDGISAGNIAVGTVAVQVAPRIDLNGNQFAGGNNFTSTWSNLGAVNIADPFVAIAFNGQGPDLTSLSATLASPTAGDVLSTNTVGTGISASYNASSGVLMLTNVKSSANYQTVLRRITFNNTLGPLNLASRTVNVVGYNGITASATAVASITIQPLRLDLNGNLALGTGYNTFWSNAGPVSIEGSAGATAATVVNGKVANLVSLTATLLALHAGDVLSADTGGTSISASYDSGLGVLTLSGSDSVANYQNVLRSIKYDNTSGGPGVVLKTIDFLATDALSGTSSASSTVQIVTSGAQVVDRYLFYNQSGTGGGTPRYDGDNAAINASDDNAIALDKAAYIPNGVAANFSNVSSYSKGINGIMIDLAGTHGSIEASDFVFRVGNNNSPSSWTTAPAPASISVRAGAGAGGSDRITIIWNNNDIDKQWLQVVMLSDAGTGTGLAQLAGYTAGYGDIFYFGNAVGDSGQGDTTTLANVDITDELEARNHSQGLSTNFPVTNTRDYNRDAIVDVADNLIARSNLTTGGGGANPSVFFINLAAGSPPNAPEGVSGDGEQDGRGGGGAVAAPLAASVDDGANDVRSALALLPGGSTALDDQLPAWLVDRVCEDHENEAWLARPASRLARELIAKPARADGEAGRSAGAIDASELLLEALLAAIDSD